MNIKNRIRNLITVLYRYDEESAFASELTARAMDIAGAEYEEWEELEQLIKNKLELEIKNANVNN